MTRQSEPPETRCLSGAATRRQKKKIDSSTLWWGFSAHRLHTSSNAAVLPKWCILLKHCKIQCTEHSKMFIRVRFSFLFFFVTAVLMSEVRLTTVESVNPLDSVHSSRMSIQHIQDDCLLYGTKSEQPSFSARNLRVFSWNTQSRLA